MAEKIKKCPHGCTGDPEPLRFTFADSPRYRVVVTCSACGAAGGPVTGNDEDDCIAAAVELWNRRAPAIEKAREALRVVAADCETEERNLPNGLFAQSLGAIARRIRRALALLEVE